MFCLLQVQVQAVNKQVLLVAVSASAVVVAVFALQLQVVVKYNLKVPRLVKQYKVLQVV